MNRKLHAHLIQAASMLLALFLSSGACPAQAEPVDDALAHFAADKFPETDKGIDELIATGAPTTPAILDALSNGRLFFDPRFAQSSTTAMPPTRSTMPRPASRRTA